MARYIDPFVDYLRKILEYRKFKEGTKLEVDEALRRERHANPQRVAYAISVSQEHPGALTLSYIRNQNPHHEYIAVSNKGYRFRQQYFTR
jgi:transcription elongation factor SPT6